MEDNAARPEPGEVIPSEPPLPAVHRGEGDAADRLRQLEEEIARLKEQIAPPPTPSPLAGTIHPESGEGEPDGTDAAHPLQEDQPLTHEQQVEIEALIKQAQLARIRKQPSLATKILKEAAEKAPGSALVLEALGDDQMERRVYNAAATSYEKALKLAPDNIALEKKHADAIYYTHAAGIGLDLADDIYGSPKWRIVIAMILPGVGQMVRGAWAKGLIILGGFVGALIVTSIVRGLTAKGTSSDARFAFAIPLAAALAFWLWGIIDASAGGKGPPPPKLDRPKPPVDLPFE
ncbi:MAG: hypothetical protein WAO58_02920 [Fimbriimonadaceae bacterium]